DNQASRLLGYRDGRAEDAAEPAVSGPQAKRFKNTKKPKTLVFCTAFARTLEVWNSRYRRWLNAIQASGLVFDQIMIVDDGSPILPEWNDIEILPADSAVESDNSILL